MSLIDYTATIHSNLEILVDRISLLLFQLPGEVVLQGIQTGSVAGISSEPGDIEAGSVGQVEEKYIREHDKFPALRGQPHHVGYLVPSKPDKPGVKFGHRVAVHDHIRLKGLRPGHRVRLGAGSPANKIGRLVTLRPVVISEGEEGSQVETLHHFSF